MTRESGFATTEFTLGVGLLLLPTLLLVALVPRWSEARLAAATAADAAASAGALAVALGLDADGAAREAAAGVLHTREVDGVVRVEAGPSEVVVEVEVALPVFPLILKPRDPIGGGVDSVELGALTTAARSVQLVDPYRAPGAAGEP